MFNPPKPDRELDQLPVALNSLALAAPAAHPLGKVKNLRLRDMTDARFIWFPRRESAAFYDRLMYECFRGGLKSPRIVQEASNEATILTLVAQGMGVGFVVDRPLAMSGRRGDIDSRRPQAVVAIGSRLEKGQPVPAALQICERRGEFGEAETDYAAQWPAAAFWTNQVRKSSLTPSHTLRSSARDKFRRGAFLT
jgi:DNA-binding transcriptional LysR family regulator